MARTALAAAALALAGLATPALADYTLTILHTNDFHSRIEPINKYDSACGEKDAAEGACFGGSARLVTAIRERRAALPNSILVDGGDQFQGSLFYTTYKGRAAAELMNALGYEAMTVGNHEFDDGPEVLRGFMAAVEFPVLLANADGGAEPALADVGAEPALADVLRPSMVIEKGGQRIGLIGLTPVETAELASPGPNIRFTDPIPALEAEVARLTADGIDKIVVLSHSGYRRDLEIAAAVPGVDVIVGGHSHTLLSNVSDKAEGPYPTWVDGPGGARVPVVQAYAYGKFLGELTVTWDDAGRVTAASGEPIVMDGRIAEDGPLKARIAELAGAFDQIRNKVVAEAAAPIDGERTTCRATECQMGNLVADAMLDRVKGQGIRIAIANGGGLRASIDAGPVTMGEILTVLPFQNTLATFALTGADVIAALENGVSQAEQGAGRFPQVAGIRYTWRRSAPPGARIVSVETRDGDGWVPLDPAAVYGVVSNDYVRRGGDGYAVFAERAIDAYDFGPALEQVLADYMIAGGAYTPVIEGRITAVD